MPDTNIFTKEEIIKMKEVIKLIEQRGGNICKQHRGNNPEVFCSPDDGLPCILYSNDDPDMCRTFDNALYSLRDIVKFAEE